MDGIQQNTAGTQYTPGVIPALLVSAAAVFLLWLVLGRIAERKVFQKAADRGKEERGTAGRDGQAMTVLLSLTLVPSLLSVILLLLVRAAGGGDPLPAGIWEPASFACVIVSCLVVPIPLMYRGLARGYGKTTRTEIETAETLGMRRDQIAKKLVRGRAVPDTAETLVLAFIRILAEYLPSMAAARAMEGVHGSVQAALSAMTGSTVFLRLWLTALIAGAAAAALTMLVHAIVERKRTNGTRSKNTQKTE